MNVFLVLCLSAMFLSQARIWPGAVVHAAWSDLAAAQGDALALDVRVSYSVKNDLSPVLSTLQKPAPSDREMQELAPRHSLPKATRSRAPFEAQPDPVLQWNAVLGAMPEPQFNFDGIDNRNRVLPPDPNGDVGLNHYVQWINLSMAIWELDRATHTATLVYGPADGNAIWDGFGGACEQQNDGDPIVLYDHLVDRWLVSQFALIFPNQPGDHGEYYECIAISQTGDPTGAWYRYAFLYHDQKVNDYPKLAVWPDAYYMSANQFSDEDWAGMGVVAFEREKMLSGQAARQVYIDLEPVNPDFGGMLPADLDGPPPPVNTPGYFAEVDDATFIEPEDALRIWEFRVDWAHPENSTFGLAGQPNVVLPVANFSPLCVYTRDCVPQPDTDQRLDGIGDRLMHRLQYRFFGDYATLVMNHSVDIGGQRAAVRWYEVRKGSEYWEIYQQGTYAGGGSNSESRWMGSIAMDGAGDIAVGYSVSSLSVYPSIRYAGRLAGDPLGMLPQGEGTLMAGSGSQVHSASRWGDYSMLSVDPVDDCTFWYTNEYYAITSYADWRTRISSFIFPSCLDHPRGNLWGVVTDASSMKPIHNARVDAGKYSTLTDQNGYYQFFDLPTGVYTVTFSLYGFYPVTISDYEVIVNPTDPLDGSMTPAPIVTVSGMVSDGSGQGWPLYARIDISAPGHSEYVFTNPVSGVYRVKLAQGSPFDFRVSAVSDGYLSASEYLAPLPGNLVKDFSLTVDSLRCIAPGYVPDSGCVAQPGGLLVGNVEDQNTSTPINDATVVSVDGLSESVMTIATPDDPAVRDGFYTLFSSATGERDFVARKELYGDDVHSVNVSLSQVAPQDFSLPAGRLVVTDNSLWENLDPGEQVAKEIVLSNIGTLESRFSITEIAGSGSEETLAVIPALESPAEAPWLEVRPFTGKLPAGWGQALTFTFNSNQAQEGWNIAHIVINHDTPYAPIHIWVMLNVIGRSAFFPTVGR